MVAFSSLVLPLLAVAGVLAAPTELSKRYLGTVAKRQTTTTSETGTSQGFYWQFWNGGGGSGTFTLGGPGEYTMSWSGQGNLLGGTGWNPGAARVISYGGTWSTNGNGYLSVYGWTENPLVEYYITENFGDYDPSSAAQKAGSVTSDGGTYTILQTTRTNEPSILGTSTFQQYWSVRQEHRTSGTVTTANHFNAWQALGFQMGTFNYQIVSTEGYHSDGNAHSK